MRTVAFAKRTIKEILRDPLSYLFVLGFPIVMLVIMTIVDQSIPKQGQVEVFHIKALAPGIAIFGFGFVMIFTALQISKDRTTALLMRLYASPLKAKDFIMGYTIPVVVIAIGQVVVTFVASSVIGFFVDYHFSLGYMLACLLVLLPSAFLFIGFGLLLGTVFNDKAAPGICSIIISVSGMLGGIWMDVDSIGGTLKKISQVLPFYPGTMSARYAMNGEFGKLGKPLAIILVYGIVVYVLAIVVFYQKMEKDLR